MKFGRFEIFQLSDGLFQLTDSMMEEFSGNETKLGEKKTSRILVSINVVVIRDEKNIILCDTGIGTKHRDQACDFPTPKGKAISVKEQLKLLNILPLDVTYVIMTHLHYDHSGGLTCYDDEGNLNQSFPNAKVFIQEEEWEAAQQAVYKGSRGYKSDNWGVYQNSANLQIIDGDEEVLTGISVVKTNGHTRGHQIIKITSGEGQIAGVFGDIIPTPFHFTKNLKMKVDFNPEKSKSARAKIVDQAMDEDWLLFFYHAPHVKAGKGYFKTGSTVKVKKFEDKSLWPTVV